jgi:hypothetical protein
MPNSALPEHLRGKLHNDWIFPFCYIPRGWTAFKLFQPPIILLAYNCDEIQEYNGKAGFHPIQKTLNGKFCSWHINFPFYFCISLKFNFFFMIGCRWDAVDFYYNFPTIAWGRIGGFES